MAAHIFEVVELRAVGPEIVEEGRDAKGLRLRLKKGDDRRARDPGGGCFIDVSMAESLLLWNAISFNAPMRRGEGLLNGGAAFYQIYATAARRFVTLSPLEPKFWAAWCRGVAVLA